MAAHVLDEKVVALANLVKTKHVTRRMESEGRAYYLAAHLIRALQQCRHGCVAEVGSADGGSAQFLAGIMLELRDVRPLHVYDTCTGLPEPESEDDGCHGLWTGRWACNEELLRAGFTKFPWIQLHVGTWPESMGAERHDAHAFVHMDCDLYRFIRRTDEVYGERMPVHGRILFDDYNPQIPGAVRAVDEIHDPERWEFIKLPQDQQAIWVRK